MSTQKPGFSLSFEGQDMNSYVSSIHLRSAVDGPAELRVLLALGPKDEVALEPSQFPEKSKLRVYDRGVFAGSLVDAQRREAGIVELIYIDSLYKVARVTESDFFKGLTLEDYLRRVSKMAQLTPRFQGTFSSKLPAFNVTGSSILEHIQKISFTYGFHFHARSFASEILFTRLDKFGEALELDAQDVANGIVSAQTRHAANEIYKAGEVRFFDSSTQKSDKKDLTQDRIYAPLGYLKESASFQRRAKRAVPAGREERLSTQAKLFGESDDFIANELSKKALEQESLIVECWSLPALPGDKLSVKKLPDTDADGSYFVKGMSIEVGSHRPLVKLNLHRA